MKRCEWCLRDALYVKYHDEEWGKPCFDDNILFEFLILESMQAGLSWLTILKKREDFRIAFDNFDVTKVSRYDEKKIESLLINPKIIRNRLKIEAAINNAQRFIEIQSEFGSFSKFLWRYVNNHPIINHWQSITEVPATSLLSDKLSKDLKILGFKFVGSTIVYSYLQAIGVIDDHIDTCFAKIKSK